MLSNCYPSQTYHISTFTDITFDATNVLYNRKKFKALQLLSNGTKHVRFLKFYILLNIILIMDFNEIYKSTFYLTFFLLSRHNLFR